MSQDAAQAALIAEIIDIYRDTYVTQEFDLRHPILMQFVRIDLYCSVVNMRLSVCAFTLVRCVKIMIFLFNSSSRVRVSFDSGRRANVGVATEMDRDIFAVLCEPHLDASHSNFTRSIFHGAGK